MGLTVVGYRKSFWFLILTGLLFVLAGCETNGDETTRADESPASTGDKQAAEDEQAQEKSPVWVHKTLSGGIQCKPSSGPRPADDLKIPSLREGGSTDKKDQQTEDEAGASEDEDGDEPEDTDNKGKEDDKPRLGGPKDTTAPKDAKDLLSQMDVELTVLESERVRQAVCEACSCPQWAYDYKLKIPADQVDLARDAGFKPVGE